MDDFSFGPTLDFSGLPPNYSDTFPLYLDSLGRSLPGTEQTIVRNDPYDSSCEGQQIFPYLVECLELFDRSFTSSSHISTILADCPQRDFNPFPTPPELPLEDFEPIFHPQNQVPWPFDPQCAVDVTSYLSMSQFRASRLLRIRPATLRKKWMEATHNRKWPYRTLKRLDREIALLSRNIQLGSSSGEMIEHFARLLKDRESQLAPVKISFADPLL